MEPAAITSHPAQLPQRTHRPSQRRWIGPSLPLARHPPPATRHAILALLLLSAALRLPGIDRPLVGNFATKNVTYAMIARNWANGQASVWRPTVDCIVGGQRGWHLVEFPVAAYVAGAGWKWCGGSLDVWGRGVSIACSMAAVALLYVLARRWHGATAALGAGAALALSPVSIIYGQSFMLESSVVCLTLLTFWCVERRLTGGYWMWTALFAVALSLLVLTKIYMLVIMLPLAWLVGRVKKDSSIFGGRPYWELTVAAVLAIAPAAWWYASAAAAAAPDSVNAIGPDSTRIYYSIRHSVEAHGFPHPLLHSGDFYRQLLDDLTGPILTPLAFVLALLGCLHPAWRRHVPWLVAMGVLVLVLPRKFYEMNYYGLVIVPPLCLLAGLGWQLVYDRLRCGRIAVAGGLLVWLILSMRYAAGPAFVTPAADRGVVQAAAAVRDLAAKSSARGERGGDMPIATMHGSSTDLLYYCNAPGWAISPDDPTMQAQLHTARRMGTRWLVVADLARLNARPNAAALLASLPIIRQGDDFRVYGLDSRGRKE